MGSHTTDTTMNTNLVLLFAFVCVASGRIFFLDDGEVEQYRVRRDAPPAYGPPAPAYAPAPSYGGYAGRVGPVYTFVKTDPQTNFKWGVRHRAGAQYGRYGARGLHGRRELSVTTSATRWRNLTLLCIIHSPHG